MTVFVAMWLGVAMGFAMGMVALAALLSLSGPGRVPPPPEIDDYVKPKNNNAPDHGADTNRGLKSG